MQRMGFNRRLALAGGAAAAAGLGYLAVHKPGGGGGKRRIERDTLHRGNGAEPGSLDPAQIDTEAEDDVVADLLTGLMVNGPDARPTPGIALSWTTAPDGLSWTFKLRESAWSDGAPLTADDFVFAWRRVLDPTVAGPYAYFLYILKNATAVNAGKMPLTALGVKALDPLTLEIQLEHPAPYLLEMLNHMSMYPVPRHVVQAKGKAWTRPGNYVGNGAYVLTEWVPNEHITMIKNPRFYDAANVHIEKVIFYPTDDYGAALQRFRAGELDTQTRMAAQQIDWIRANIPQTISATPILSLEYLVVNQSRKPFNDIRVRTAMNMVIIREAITDKIRRVGDVAAYNVVPPGIENFPGGNAFPFKSLSYAERTAQAQSLMRQAGFGPDNRVKTTFMIRSTTAGSTRAVAAALQQTFALIYIDAAIVPNDFAVFQNVTHAHDFDIADSAWGADFNDAATFLNLFITGGGDNIGLYSNPAFDAKLAEAQNDIDLQSRGRKLAEAEAILLKDQAVMPLFFWTDPGMAWPYVKGYIHNNSNKNRSRWLSIDEDTRAKQFGA